MKIIVDVIRGKVVFPCLMKMNESEAIVFFVTPTEGTVVAGSYLYPPGYHSRGWSISSFTPFKGKVILSND